MSVWDYRLWVASATILAVGTMKSNPSGFLIVPEQTFYQQIVAVLGLSPLINHALFAFAVFVGLAALFASRSAARLLLAISCFLALCMPLYDLASLYIRAALGGRWIVDPWWPVLIFLVFSPTTLAIAGILRNVGRLRRLRTWATISLISAVLSWLGISLLYLSVS
jgi:hypothetical protein